MTAVTAPRALAAATAVRSGAVRSVLSAVLVVMTAVCAPLAVVAVWANSQVSDTDRFVATVAPMASDPAVQDAVVARVTDEIYRGLDIPGVTDRLVERIARPGLSNSARDRLSALVTPLAMGVRGFIEEQVDEVVRSESFERAWAAAARAAHGQVVMVLTGTSGGVVEARGDTVSLDLGMVVDAVRERLADAGFAPAAGRPEVEARFTILQSPDLDNAQRAFRLLDAVALTLPLLALACLVAAAVVARSRRTTLVVASLLVVLSMVVLRAGVALFRGRYLAGVGDDPLRYDAAASIYDRLVRFLIDSAGAVAVLFLGVAVIAWVTAPSPLPSLIRSSWERVAGALGRAGISSGRLGEFAATYRRSLRVVIVGGGVLTYVVAAHPTAGFTFVVLAVVVLLLLGLDLVAGPRDAGRRLARSGSAHGRGHVGADDHKAHFA